MSAGETTRARRSVVLKVLGVTTLVVLAVVALKLAFRAPAPGTVTGDPLAIRLVGVRPDGGDAVYDAAGTRVGQEQGRASGPEDLKTSELRREFIFDLPLAAGSADFLPLGLTFAPESTGQPIGAAMHLTVAERSGQRRLYAIATFPRSCQRRLLRFISFNADIDALDLTLWYYVGARGPAKIIFSGPFQSGVPVQADDGKAYTLTPANGQPEQATPQGVRFHLSSALPATDVSVILAYDDVGGRHLGQHGGAYRRKRSQDGYHLSGCRPGALGSGLLRRETKGAAVPQRTCLLS